MKEFVEKLIERLEAQPTEQFVGINGDHGLVSTVIDCCVECVNQLAEEYESKTDNAWRTIYNRACNLEKKYAKIDGDMESVNNCIRLENLLQYFKEELNEDKEYNQDSTKKNQGWILCSEKLPEERSWYLALFKESSTGFVGLPYIADYLMGNHTSWTTKDGWIIKDCTDTDNVNEYFKNLECVAWQPLPNPCSFTHEKELVEFCKPQEKR